jgi:RNA polymerase sigma-B factor
VLQANFACLRRPRADSSPLDRSVFEARPARRDARRQGCHGFVLGNRRGARPRAFGPSALAPFAGEHDPVDREAIVERFLPLARQLAARHQRPEEPFDDVFQVACFGLVKAVDRFDVHRGVAFSSYAVPTIVGEIRRHFRDRGWAGRVPRDLPEPALRVDRVIGELTRVLGRRPLVGVAREIDAQPEDVVEAMHASSAYRATSLETGRPRGRG